MITEFNPRLVESVVQEHALRPADWTARFHRQRSKLYDIADVEDREREFQKLYSEWFSELDLDRPILQAFSTRPRIPIEVSHASVAPAPRPRDEGVELFVRPPKPGLSDTERRRLTILLRPSTLLDERRLTTLLRRELLHVDDMLDPEFGYEPSLPSQLSGPTRDRLLLDRYAAAWGASVAGRLEREGHGTPDARTAALTTFVRPFSVLRSDAPAAFDRLYSSPRPTHAELVALVLEPVDWMTSDGQGEAARPAHSSGQRCALCAMPTAVVMAGDEIRPPVAEEIVSDFPQWEPEEGACPQCTELYDSRVRARRYDTRRVASV